MPALLEPIAAGQTRFHLQGLAPDARGVACGRETLVTFPSLDRLVAFLGAYSEECSLDELIPTMTIERARRDGGGHALLMRCAGADSYVLDRLARLSLAVHGQLFTGSGTVFVRYRDRMAPFGYDLAGGTTTAASPEEVVVVDHDVTARYRALDRLDPVELIQRLSLRQIPLPIAGIVSDPQLCGLHEIALVLVAPGLSDRILSYLWGNQVPLAGVRVALAGERRASLLLRLRQPSGQVLDVLHGIPGVELLAPVSQRAAVEIGYRHPIHLASASSCLPGDEMYLFRGRVGRVERLDGAPQFIDGAHLVRSDVAARAHEPGDARGTAVQALKVELRLRPTASIREPRGALIRWEQAGLLRRLIYLIPPMALAAARLAVLPQGMLVLTGSSLGGTAGLAAGVGAAAIIPLGMRIVEVAPGVLVPDGFELWPHVRPQLVRELLGLEAADHALFLGTDQSPLRLRPDHLAPLDAAMMSRLELAVIEASPSDSPTSGPATLLNERLGRFALWGFGEAGRGGRPAVEETSGTPELPPGRES
ncbi:hypothetical protein [Nannocystis pusilla]|uniref:hypothetical protein n=1 Tax=Nannocystis pusilla TaxID=889268 RepID=UPI003DA2FF3F